MKDILLELVILKSTIGKNYEITFLEEHQLLLTKAIEGLFVMIAREEKNIRENPVARTTDLLKRVFGIK